MDIADYGPLLTAEAFLEIDFGERIKAELEDGELRVLERGPRARVHVASNLQVAVHTRVRGTGRHSYGPLLALKTGPRSVRFPDVTVYDQDRVVARYGDRDLMGNPLLVGHVCRTDRVHSRLVDEYLALASLQGLILVDYQRSVIRAFARAAAGEWCETVFGEGGSIEVPMLDIAIPAAEVFALD